MARAPEPSVRPAGPLAGIHPNVVALGFTSLFTDVSTEMLIPVLPLFVTATLHASVASLGVIEGVAECTASGLRLGSGWLSDRIGRRKPFLLFGYGLSGVAKAAMALAASWPAVLLLRFSDRVGKGLRNPPRDALIADSTADADMGRAFGLHRGLDTLGAAIGPLLAWALLSRWRALGAGGYRRIFAASAVPAALSLLVLAVFVRARRHAPAPPRALGVQARRLGAPFWRFVAVDGLFQLGNSSTAFVLLRSERVGWSAGQVALLYFGYNLVYALLAWPLGHLSDRIGRRPLLFAGYLLYALGYALLALDATRAGVALAFALLGVTSALMDGQQKSLIADLVPRDLRASAYGAYYAVVGAALLPASVAAGLLWDHAGAAAPFALGAALAAAAGALLWAALPLRQEHADRHA